MTDKTEHHCQYKAFFDNVQRGRKIKRGWRQDYLEAKQNAILSGKVVILTCQDEITGLFYRFNKQGEIVLLGKGRNKGA